MAPNRISVVRIACLAIAGLIASSGNAQARVVEEQTRVAVKVADAHGKEIARDIVVTIWRDSDAPKPYPALVLNHGRSYKPDGRAAVGRAKYSEVSDWLARQGFIVAVPTRMGYGVTGGEDVEDTGSCSKKNYPPGYTASATQTLAVLEMLRKRPEVAPDRAVIMGQSYGGTTAVTVAALNPPGVQAAINFAGGGGGNPETRPGNFARTRLGSWRRPNFEFVPCAAIDRATCCRRDASLASIGTASAATIAAWLGERCRR